MKKFGFLALILGLGLTLGCTPAADTTTPVSTEPSATEPAGDTAAAAPAVEGSTEAPAP